MSRSSAASSKAAAAASVRGITKSSHASSELSKHLSADAQSKLESKRTGVKASIIQMKNKLKRHPDYANALENELLEDAEMLITVDGLRQRFSHLLDEPLDDAVDEVNEALKLGGGYFVNDRERQAAKEREQIRHDSVTQLRIVIRLEDVDQENDRILCGLGNFLGMDYSGKHSVVFVGDVRLEWGQENVVIPKREDGDAGFIFQGEVEENTKYHHHVASTRPQTDDDPKNWKDEFDILWNKQEQKEKVISDIIRVILLYNREYYYDPIHRNCQGFVKDVLKASGIDSPIFKQPQQQEYIERLRDGRVRVPMSFQNHEDIDAYVMKLDGKKELNGLGADDLKCLCRAYENHHNGKPCTEESCKYELVQRALAQK